MNLVHNHPLFHTSSTAPHPAVNKDMILDTLLSSLSTSTVAEDPRKITGKYVIDRVREACGEIISKSSASRAKRKIVDCLFGTVDIAFEKVKSYFTVIQSHNPGTFCKVESQDGAFFRSIMIPKFCIDAFSNCQPLIALDGKKWYFLDCTLVRRCTYERPNERKWHSFISHNQRSK
ncbi:hypothetical protein AC1031_011181 [Aphanomyces cochlioides]|nr:hypothetical protein AC1031_011181 [Aphanomyces cochlioides]